MPRNMFGKERRRLEALRATGLLILLVALLAVPSSASAAIDGKLKQLALPGGCLDDAALQGCANITAPMTNVGEPAMSPNGRFLYVPGRDSDSINVFERDTNTGALTERACIRSSTAGAAAGCSTIVASPLEDAQGAVVSPDGKSLYVVGGAAGGSAPDGIASFSLGTDGLPVFDGCFTSAASTGCLTTTGLNNPFTVAVSPDNRSVYVASYGSDAIAVFQRNTTTGTLNQAGLTTAERCIKRVSDAEGCTVVQQLGSQPRDIEVTPDGKAVIVGSVGCVTVQACYALVALDRATSTGVLSAQPGAQGCVSYFGASAPCQPGGLFFAPNQVAITNDGTQLMLAMRTSSYNWVTTVDRDPVSNDLTARDAGPSDCTENPGSPSQCTVESKALAGVHDIALSPDNQYVYTSGYESQRIGIFDRQSNGRLGLRPGDFGCLEASNQTDSCGGVIQGGTNTNIEYVLPSPDGKHVYGFGSGVSVGKIFSFAVDHAPGCSNTSVDTPHNTSVTIDLPCTDPDGDPLTWEILSQPAKGQLGATQGNHVTYGPLIGTSGTDTFTFRATGAGVQADTATVTVNVGAPPSGGGGGGVVGPSGGGGGGGPAGLVPSLVANSWAAFAKYTQVRSLAVKQILGNSTITVGCKGKGCPFKVKVIKVAKPTKVLSIAKLFNPKPKKKKRKKIAKLKVGSKITIVVSAPGFKGKVFSYTIRKGKLPKFSLQCTDPGSTQPKSCI